jgi:hypothetical protein
MMRMRLGSFHGKHHLRPTFQVDRSHDEAWFDYFYEQFVSMWNAGDPYDLITGEPWSVTDRKASADRSGSAMYGAGVHSSRGGSA